MFNIEHPIITQINLTGNVGNQDDEIPICPVCGSECSTIYYQGYRREIVGCDACINTGDAWDEEECFMEDF